MVFSKEFLDKYFRSLRLNASRRCFSYDVSDHVYFVLLLSQLFLTIFAFFRREILKEFAVKYFSETGEICNP